MIRIAMTSHHGNGRGSFVTAAKTLIAVAVVFLFVSSIAQAEAPASVPIALPSTEKRDAGEDLVLQLIIDSTEMQEFMEGVGRGGKTYLPLGELASLLDFPITVNADKKTAEGWFIKDSNRLFITEKTAKVHGVEENVPPGSLFFKDKDIFIDTVLLQKWLPLDFSVNLKRMVLNITTRENLPYQAARWRKNLHTKLEQKENVPQEKSFKKIEAPYEAAQWPSLDLTFSPSYQSSDQRAQATYSLLAGGDLGYLTSHLYAAGNLNDKQVSDARISLGRNNYERNLLGPLHASSFLFGDINSISLAQTTTAGQGRGFMMTNRALNRPDKFDVTNFIGDSKPGWEVELYRNDALIGFQIVDSSGQYEFKEIPVLFGNNFFRLSFYGPQGQREDLTRSINADSSLLSPGEFTYNISVDEKEKRLLGVGETAPEDSGGLRAVGEMEYGLTNRITVTLGSARAVVKEQDHTYTTAGLHSSFMETLTALDGAYDDTTGGYSARLSASARYLSTDIQFQQKVAKDFVSEEDKDPANLITSQTKLGLNREMHVPLLNTLVLGNNLLLTRNRYSSERIESLASYRLSTSVNGFSATNTLDYDRDNLGLSQLRGNLSLRRAYGKFQPALQTDYTIRPQAQFDSAHFSLLYPIAPKVSGNATLGRNFTGGRNTELGNTVTFDMQHYKLSLTGRVDKQGNYFAGLTFNMALARLPGSKKWFASSKSLAQTGTVAVHPYMDRNYNQQLDPDEGAPKNTLIKIGSRRLETDSDGLAVVSQLPIDTPIAINMDQGRQENPYLISSGEYHVVPRAGAVIVVNYPLMESSQVEGTVHAPAGADTASLQVDLLDAKGQVVNSTHTSFDGYYLLEGVMPGIYKLRISTDSLAKVHLKQTDERALTVEASDFYVMDINLDEAQ
jgi:hypothetical protein